MGSIVKAYGKILGKSPFPHHKIKSNLISDVVGKGGDGPQPPAVAATPDFDPTDMLGLFASLMSGMQPPEPPDPPILPEVYRDPEVDWTKRKDQLSAKAKADYLSDLEGKKGRSDTIHTSPFLDEEDPTTSGESILTGSNV